MTLGASLGQAVFVKLFRTWSAARAMGENPLPHMQSCTLPFEPAPELVVACDSLFSLTIAHLGRDLVPECCCSRALSRDEAVLIGILRHALACGVAITSPAIPHGLPCAIRWAAVAILRALHDTFPVQFTIEPSPIPASGHRCL
jgi:hypothetical protein